MRNLKTRVATASITALYVALSLACAAQAAKSSDWLIVPNQSIGRLHLGPNGAAELGKLPAPRVMDAGMSQTRQVWVSKNPAHDTLYVHTVSNGALDVRPLHGMTITEIRVTSPFFHTRSGLSTGATLSRIRRTFPHLRRIPHGPGDQTVIYNDPAQGIAFEFAHSTAAARCIGITIYIAGKGSDAGSAVRRQQVALLLHDAATTH